VRRTSSSASNITGCDIERCGRIGKALDLGLFALSGICRIFLLPGHRLAASGTLFTRRLSSCRGLSYIMNLQNFLETTAQSLGFSILLTIPVEAADWSMRVFTKPGSILTIKGESNVHSWRAEAEGPEGWIQLISTVSPMTSQGMNFQTIRACAVGFVSVRGLHTTEGETLDAVIYRLLRGADYPHIDFRLRELRLRTPRESANVSYLFDSTVELSIAGVTNQITMPLEVLSVGDRKFKITGATEFRMTDFRISPPTVQVPGSPVALKYKDRVELTLQWLVGPQDAIKN
jgi:hypothetical protein